MNILSKAMRIGAVLLVLLAAAIAVRAQANKNGECTIAVPLNSSTASQVFPFQDVSGGRHYFLIQCIGSNPCSCGMATGTGVPGVTSTTGILLAAAGLGTWPMVAAAGTTIPSGEVDCIGVGGASIALGCDW